MKAIVLAMLALSVSAYQRGGSVGGASSSQDCNGPDRSGTGAAGLGRDQPCPQPVEPPAADPAVKAKLDYERNLKDAATLAQLANDVRRELESGGVCPLPAGALKKSGQMVKLAKALHDRMTADIADGRVPAKPDRADANKKTTGSPENNPKIGDAARVAQLAGEIGQDLRSGGGYTFSIGSLKKSEEMARHARELRDRMTHCGSVPGG